MPGECVNYINVPGNLTLPNIFLLYHWLNWSHIATHTCKRTKTAGQYLSLDPYTHLVMWIFRCYNTVFIVFWPYKDQIKKNALIIKFLVVYVAGKQRMEAGKANWPQKPWRISSFYPWLFHLNVWQNSLQINK